MTELTVWTVATCVFVVSFLFVLVESLTLQAKIKSYVETIEDRKPRVSADYPYFRALRRLKRFELIIERVSKPVSVFGIIAFGYRYIPLMQDEVINDFAGFFTTLYSDVGWYAPGGFLAALVAYVVVNLELKQFEVWLKGESPRAWI